LQSTSRSASPIPSTTLRHSQSTLSPRCIIVELVCDAIMTLTMLGTLYRRATPVCRSTTDQSKCPKGHHQHRSGDGHENHRSISTFRHADQHLLSSLASCDTGAIMVIGAPVTFPYIRGMPPATPLPYSPLEASHGQSVEFLLSNSRHRSNPLPRLILASHPGGASADSPARLTGGRSCHADTINPRPASAARSSDLRNHGVRLRKRRGSEGLRRGCNR
jgi:hypothetical protein